jgi:hypothetical protein
VIKRTKTREVPPVEAENLLMDEAIERYDGEWVLLRVTGRDESNSPSRGDLIGHGGKARLKRKLIEILSQPDHLPGPYYLFLAYPRIRNGAELPAILARLDGSYPGP